MVAFVYPRSAITAASPRTMSALRCSVLVGLGIGLLDRIVYRLFDQFNTDLERDPRDGRRRAARAVATGCPIPWPDLRFPGASSRAVRAPQRGAGLAGAVARRSSRLAGGETRVGGPRWD